MLKTQLESVNGFRNIIHNLTWFILHSLLWKNIPVREKFLHQQTWIIYNFLSKELDQLEWNDLMNYCDKQITQWLFKSSKNSWINDQIGKSQEWISDFLVILNPTQKANNLIPNSQNYKEGQNAIKQQCKRYFTLGLHFFSYNWFLIFCNLLWIFF